MEQVEKANREQLARWYRYLLSGDTPERRKIDRRKERGSWVELGAPQGDLRLALEADASTNSRSFHASLKIVERASVSREVVIECELAAATPLLTSPTVRSPGSRFRVAEAMNKSRSKSTQSSHESGRQGWGHGVLRRQPVLVGAVREALADAFQAAGPPRESPVRHLRCDPGLGHFGIMVEGLERFQLQSRQPRLSERQVQEEENHCQSP
jgi:hypothetical protein